jgi:hypothetical protein
VQNLRYALVGDAEDLAQFYLRTALSIQRSYLVIAIMSGWGVIGEGKFPVYLAQYT